jgi:SAM-dependent methyltransferase
MSVDERFDDLAASIGGFYRSWVAYLGLELGYFVQLRTAGREGLSADALAAGTDCQPEPTAAWLRAANAHELVDFDGTRATLEEDLATVLLDDDRAEFLGGQVASTVVASLDYERLVEFFHTGVPIAERPPRFHRAIEKVTVQDIAVFFQEGLAALPALTDDLARGIRVLDVACGGGRWLIAVARRFPASRFVGVEFEPDSVARAMRRVSKNGLDDRISIQAREIADMAFPAEFDLAYFQDALHEVPDPVGALRAAWTALAPEGRLLVLDWCLPSTVEEDRTLHSQLLWGINIDELYEGARMYTREGFVELFRTAQLPEPTIIDLPSGATLFLATKAE